MGRNPLREICRMEVTGAGETFWLPHEEQLLIGFLSSNAGASRWWAVKVTAGARPALEQTAVALDARLILVALTAFNRGKLLGFDLRRHDLVQLKVKYANSDG